MRRNRAMPFGAEVLEDGRVRFGLWAPAAREVDLCIEDDREPVFVRMERAPGGWFRLTTGLARAGSLYRYRIDGEKRVPDPASRCNPADVHGPSLVVDPRAFAWSDAGWTGRPWEEAVIYELHVGTFTPEGTFGGVKERLGYLADLGVTALQLMPVADFPGRRNWGYDGVLPFAPDGSYGTPEALKEMIQAAHGAGLMVFLDVVYNHFGPEGNYLHLYAPQFFTERHRTPWGAAINFDGPESRTVRDFFIHNALYWIEEYNVDGLRLDAVHAIEDDSSLHVLEELAEAVQAGPARGRHVHLVLENDRNEARYLTRRETGRPRWYAAQWNDDIHHVLHVLVTGESDGYYADYADDPVRHLGRCLAEGFAYQGEASACRGGESRGEPSKDLPPAAFVSFLQTHDQVGNRALGERISALADPRAVRAAAAILLLAPSPPLLFMGEEFAAGSPFLFFCDFGPDLAASVAEGRRREFARSAPFADTEIPDPCTAETFERSKLDWQEATRAPHRDSLVFYRRLLAIRSREIVPRLAGTAGNRSRFETAGPGCFRARWTLGDGSVLRLAANLGRGPSGGLDRPAGALLFATDEENLARDPWSVAWFLDRIPPPESAA
ncbi:MAG: malto-oligosyltrehalose trehalohydrolase [Nitrospirae bacterium RBG_16_64_22]|nr:MAG: malto-oligosyltrehalose trehalohydrolase [Nitrospirae bacterium RBG_16_64_22]